MSQKQLADAVGVTRQTIIAIENGDYNPTIRLCIEICLTLGKTLDQLFWEGAEHGRTILDERQLQKKHKAGNQAFMLLAFLLLADMGLQNYGIHWLEYPLSNYVIFLVGVGSYLVRIIWNGSYAGPGSGNLAAHGRSLLGGVLAMLVALCVITAAWMGSSGKTSEGTGTGPAILMISTAVGLVILGTVFWIRRRNNRDEA